MHSVGAEHAPLAFLGDLPEKNRKRTAALVIETLKYKSVLTDVIEASKLMTSERKITSIHLALVLVHDLLLVSMIIDKQESPANDFQQARGIQAGDGPVKQAILRHKTRLHSEFTKIKIKRGITSNAGLAQSDERTGEQLS